MTMAGRWRWHYISTLSFSIILMLLLVLLFNPFAQQEQLQHFRYAGESAGRMLDRHMEFYAAYDQVPAWERSLHTFLFGEQKQVVADVIAGYREVLRYFDQHPESTTPWSYMNTRSRLMVTLAENGYMDELRAMIAEPTQTPEQDVLNDAFRFAYLNDNSVDQPSVTSGARMMPLGWAADRLWIRIAQRNQDSFGESYISRRHVENGQRLRHRVWLLSISVGMIIISGLLLTYMRWPLIRQLQWPDGILARPWGFYEGLAVMVRAAVLGLLIAIVLQILAQHFFRPGLLALWSTLFASLPMLWLIRRRLLSPRAMSLRQGFGIKIRQMGVGRFISITLVFLTLEWLGMMLISWVTWKLGLAEQWTEGINERMFFAPNETVLLSAVNMVLWAPIFEEIGFRGLLYTTLRSRLGVWAAIVLSAFLFSALHLYSLSGFLSVFWSGIVLAYIYERYHSLLPGIVIHALSNLLSLSVIVLFYR